MRTMQCFRQGQHSRYYGLQTAVSAHSFLCWKYGIDYIEQEESYTSKSSVLDRDELPVYDPKQQISGKFSGQRIHRGLYMSKNGTAINADVNGSANILRKGKQNLDFEKLCMGLLASPERIRVL